MRFFPITRQFGSARRLEFAPLRLSSDTSTWGGKPAPSRQHVRQELVTHVLGTRCYLSLRAGRGDAGAARGIRTPDPVITNDVLYRLSYCGGPCGASGFAGDVAPVISGGERV